VLPSSFRWSLHGVIVFDNVNCLEKHIEPNLLDFSAFFQTLFLQAVLCYVRIFKRMRLHDKGVQCPDSSPHCENHYKKKWHIFIGCEKARQIWTEAGLWNTISCFFDGAAGFTNMFFTVLCRLSASFVADISMTLWCLCRRRNDKVWNDEVKDP